MHRTEGEDYILESGKRRFAAANPPTQKATRLPAEFMNAVQEEICSVINAAVPAIPLNSTAAADRTAGWNQLLQALQEGQLIKVTSFNTTAIADGLASGTGFTEASNSRAAVDLLRSTFANGFDRSFGYYNDPSPDAPIAKKIPLAVLAQAIGSEQLIVVDNPSTDTLDLALGGLYSDAWDSHLTIVITGAYTNATLTIDAPTPRRSRVTLINAGWGPSSDTSSSYGSITWHNAGLVGFTLRHSYSAEMHFNDIGGRVDLRQLPPHAVPFNGPPAFWSRLHGIRDMKTVDVETAIVTPASGNPTYPFPLLMLDQTTTNVGGTAGAGVRVAGDVGVEVPQSTVSRLGNSRKRKTGRIFHSLNGELMWHKGLDASGVQRGYVRLDNPVETTLRHYRTVDGNFPADGSSIGFFSHIGDTSRFNLSPFINDCTNNKAMVLFSGLDIPAGESITLQLVLRRWLCDGSNNFTDIVSLDTVVTTVDTGNDVLRSVEFPFLSNYVFAAGRAVEPLIKVISRTGAGTKSIGSIMTAIEFTRVSES